MGERRVIVFGMAAGLVWAAALLWGAAQHVRLPIFTLMPTIMTAFLAPGIVTLLMVGRRFLDDARAGAAPERPGAATDRRVLDDTLRQLVLALCVWPAAAVLLGGAGPGVIVTLGAGFAVARLAFWAGAHVSPPLCAFGRAATFFPSVLVALWALAAAVTLGGG